MTSRILNILLILSLSISQATLAATAKVYVWTNEQGVLVFSDSPRPGAEEMEIDSSNVMESSIDTSILDIKPKKNTKKFEVQITQPENNSTIRDNTGSVHVTGRIKPVFKRGYKIQLFIDDIPYKTPQSHSMFALRDIVRGEHQIKMDLIDQSGKIIASSNTVTFYMHRASIGN